MRTQSVKGTGKVVINGKTYNVDFGKFEIKKETLWDRLKSKFKKNHRFEF